MGALKNARARLARRRGNLKEAREHVTWLEKRVANVKATIARLRRPLRRRALDEARELVGVTEHGGNNRGDTVEKIIHYAQGMVPEPWCVDFVIWCYGHAGSNIVKPGFTRAVRFMHTPGMRRTRFPKRGQIVRYTFDHTGLFVTWCDVFGNPRSRLLATHIKAIEGNTGSAGAVSDSATGGDGVYIKVRPRSQVSDFLRATG